jgi:hypothetical protein
VVCIGVCTAISWVCIGVCIAISLVCIGVCTAISLVSIGVWLNQLVNMYGYLLDKVLIESINIVKHRLTVVPC